MKTVVVYGQQRWESLSLTRFSEAALLNALNEAGRDGWEPIGFIYYKEPKGSLCWTAICKRPAFGQPGKPAEGAPGEAAKPEAKAATDAKVGETSGFDLSGDTFDIKPEPKPQPKPEPKPELKPELKPEAKPAAKPEAKAPAKPEATPAGKH